MEVILGDAAMPVSITNLVQFMISKPGPVIPVVAVSTQHTRLHESK